ncbi:MAG: pyridoxamine 5'-phosphate oxidase [Vicinamibacterales bacterium]|jgi:pyridoxamine 5'-phosphate oxidase|nr:pyridoxamine 5'-phosphate oxidase [Acidobacteriota bacterium]MDP6372038.1 pyridoxamine 5'-phosphate oxidase [Vicinamibacterales bacterium]HCV25378.1 pyridoxamine 5'-phosphate oxidase [Candidatus Latescibacterota bacterium]MDP6610298.1 pyridoxamine 5'-phosphate oxidase [Vicinamibacterales bacterium]MDP7339726.1 pyridoxamine 5'-phosphate oxidase [Vicinamibacterales bacterium]|tara:strand:+ start:1181 stop:1855 length:675 start_codon:yes stop_codon:yes gene_type:complete
MSLLDKLRLVLSLGQGIKGLTKGLAEAEAGTDPIELFNAWFDRAKGSGVALPEAMTLATASKDGAPSARMVLLKGVDERGFIFYTNYDSRKCRDLDENPRAALVCHWTVLQRQVRIEGTVERTGAEESAVYFHTRGRGSQIGAWASAQSAALESYDQLVRKAKDAEEKFRGQEVPLPPFWGGYVVRPTRIEFWQGRANRLHDRLVYERDGDEWKLTWKVTRLNP